MAVQGMVGTLGVREDHSVGERAGEEGNIGQQQRLVGVPQGLLHRPVQAFPMTVPLRRHAGGGPTPDPALLENTGNLAFERTPVVGQQRPGSTSRARAETCPGFP